MNMTGIVYRPPYEANSLLLQVTLGCSHNKCTFCYMYPDVQFKVCPMEEVEADIDEATRYCPHVKRVFLEHGDAFVLSAERLLRIADAIHRNCPRWKPSPCTPPSRTTKPNPTRSFVNSGMLESTAWILVWRADWTLR